MGCCNSRVDNVYQLDYTAKVDLNTALQYLSSVEEDVDRQKEKRRRYPDKPPFKAYEIIEVNETQVNYKIIEQLYRYLGGKIQERW